MKNPKFKDCYHVATLDGEGVFLVNEENFGILKGDIFEALAPLLSGKQSIDEIVEKLKEKLPPEQVHYGIMQLENKGYLVDGESGPAMCSNAAYWQLAGVENNIVHSQSIHVVGTQAMGQVMASSLTERLSESGVTISKDLNSSDLLVVLAEDYLDPELSEFNQQAIEQNRPWLLIKPTGVSTWVGPYFKPGESACWSCLCQRLSGHRMVETFIQHRQNLSRVPRTNLATPPSAAAALEFALAEILHTLNGAPRCLDKVLSFDHRDFTTESHQLIKRPQCQACGDSSIREAQPLNLSTTDAASIGDGGYRSVTPEVTVRRFQHHVSHITGIIRYLEPQAHKEDKVKHIYSAGHNFAMLVEDVSFLSANLRMGSGGKGKTDMQAKASAIGEALERYSGLFQGDEPRRLSTMAELGDAAIHPYDVLLFSQEQFDTRKEWNEEHDRYQFVPEPFDSELEIEWSPLWSISENRFRYLPAAACWYGYNHHPLVKNGNLPAGFAFADSNGCAAGNSKEEAVMQGLMELVERDSVACWWYSRCQRPEVNLSSFSDPYFQEMIDHYLSIGRKLWVLDVTNDLGIPSFVAVSYRLDNELEEITWGCGCHIDPHIGILRALTEVNQFLAAFERLSSPSERYIGFDPEAVRWFKTARLEEQSYMIPSTTLPAMNAEDYKTPISNNIVEDLAWCIQQVNNQGIDVLVQDQTRGDVELPVVRVIAPGLRHFFARFGPGRLYDVPYKLGWVPEKLEQKDLNPIPVFF